MPEDKSDMDPPQESELMKGIYRLTNKKTRLVLDLNGGKPESGTKCWGCTHEENAWFPNKVWCIRRDGADGSYTLQNLRGATFLDLTGGQVPLCSLSMSQTINSLRRSKDDGSPVRAHSRKSDADGRANAEWHFKADAAGYYTIQCRRTGTCLALALEEGKREGLISVCSLFDAGSARQLWEVTRVSRSGEEIIDIVKDWNETLLPPLRQTYRRDAQYIMVPSELRKEIWRNAGLQFAVIRPGTFDYDDFVVKMKDAVASWARQEYRVDGVALLFGIIYGQSKRGPYAYNWYLSADMHTLVFFDAQTGMEYTGAALDAFGFQPVIAIF